MTAQTKERLATWTGRVSGGLIVAVLVYAYLPAKASSCESTDTTHKYIHTLERGTEMLQAQLETYKGVNVLLTKQNEVLQKQLKAVPTVTPAVVQNAIQAVKQDWAKMAVERVEAEPIANITTLASTLTPLEQEAKQEAKLWGGVISKDWLKSTMMKAMQRVW